MTITLAEATQHWNQRTIRAVWDKHSGYGVEVKEEPYPEPERHPCTSYKSAIRKFARIVCDGAQE